MSGKVILSLSAGSKMSFQPPEREGKPILPPAEREGKPILPPAERERMGFLSLSAGSRMGFISLSAGSRMGFLPPTKRGGMTFPIICIYDRMILLGEEVRMEWVFHHSLFP